MINKKRGKRLPDGCWLVRERGMYVKYDPKQTQILSATKIPAGKTGSR